MLPSAGQGDATTRAAADLARLTRLRHLVVVAESVAHDDAGDEDISVNSTSSAEPNLDTS
jgi:hypothetical protein